MEYALEFTKINNSLRAINIVKVHVYTLALIMIMVGKTGSVDGNSTASHQMAAPAIDR